MCDENYEGLEGLFEQFAQLISREVVADLRSKGYTADKEYFRLLSKKLDDLTSRIIELEKENESFKAQLAVVDIPEQFKEAQRIALETLLYGYAKHEDEKGWETE